MDDTLSKVYELQANLAVSTGKSDLTKIDTLLYGLEEEVETAVVFGDVTAGYST